MEFVLLVSGAALSVLGGIVARRYESRRQARSDILNLIGPLTEASFKITGPYLSAGAFDDWVRLTDRIYRAALLASSKELELATALRNSCGGWRAIHANPKLVSAEYADDLPVWDERQMQSIMESFRHELEALDIEVEKRLRDWYRW